jgi:hypothetical protein
VLWLLEYVMTPAEHDEVYIGASRGKRRTGDPNVNIGEVLEEPPCKLRGIGEAVEMYLERRCQVRI